MTNEWFDLSADAGVAHLRLNRPEAMNTMSLRFLNAFREAVAGLDADGGTRALVISSTGKHFTAGMALEEFAGSELLEVNEPRGRLRLQSLVRALMDCFDVLDRARFPVIAAVHGGCIGGGVDLIAACDVRYCTADAFFCIQEVNIGIVADLGTLQRLPKLMPPGVVREYAYTGRRMPAARAREVGLVNEVCADQAAMLEVAMAAAREIAGKSPLVIAGSKAALNYARDHSTSEALDHMAVLQSAIFSPAEVMEAIGAMRQKRPAAFKELPATKRGAG